MCTFFVLRIDRRKISTSSVSIFALSLAFLEIQFSDLVGFIRRNVLNVYSPLASSVLVLFRLKISFVLPGFSIFAGSLM